MSPPRIFDSDCDGDTLVIMLLGDVSTLIPEHARVELNQALEKLRPPEVKHVVVDFEQIGYFGSLMLGSLHIIWKRVRQSGGRMALCNVSPTGREVLRVARFDTLWPICGSREEALATVRQDRRQAG
ncbi:MAG TPA: anti-sigma factor antagonist [Planctomycetaceae bacterium]|nr:anti-sigma factor antagonist [Planctomycetaceae bacterium]HIQ22230.1 anti-sigma factor antagonist [Planctomycetota bacterium]